MTILINPVEVANELATQSVKEDISFGRFNHIVPPSINEIDNIERLGKSYLKSIEENVKERFRYHYDYFFKMITNLELKR